MPSQPSCENTEAVPTVSIKNIKTAFKVARNDANYFKAQVSGDPHGHDKRRQTLE